MPSATASAATLSPQLRAQLQAADALQHSGQWAQALHSYSQLHQDHPTLAPIIYQIALCHQGLGNGPAALACACQSWQMQPSLWPAGLLLARLQHQHGDTLTALQTLRQLRQQHPNEPAITLEAARRSLHTLGNPRDSARLVDALRHHPQHGASAQRMQLLAQLYDRPDTLSAQTLSAQITAHAQSQLQIHRPPGPPNTPPINRQQPLRVGLLANQLHASPVYFLTIGTLQALAPQVQWIVFSRSTRRDWATTAFEHIATEWHHVAGQNAHQLARTLASAQLPALIDLCGWMDPTALQALSTRPAARQYKWVGGQSLSTGLGCFDGFISDEHHTPPGNQALYTEPLILVPGGYAGYHPPPYQPAPQNPPPDGQLHLGLVSNPAKASLACLQHLREHWPHWQAQSPLPLRLHLIDQRYQIPHLQQHMRTQLPGIRLQFDCPDSHAHYLQALGQLHAVLDTWPYSGGLTTLEAHSLGVPVYTHSQGQLFCERHSHAHQQFLGLPQAQLIDPDFLPSHALQVDRHQLRQHAARRQDVRRLANFFLNLVSTS